MNRQTAPPGIARLALAAIAALALVVAVLTGLARLGWSVGTPRAIASHGPLFALGFLGTVIALERAVAMGRLWVWLVPTASAAGVVALLMELPAVVPGLMSLAAATGLVFVFVVAHRSQPELHLVIMGSGALAWMLAAAGLIAGIGRPGWVPAMAGFLVLTIVGERIEMTRLLGMSAAARRAILLGSGLVLAGAGVGLVATTVGARVSGIGLLICAGWLVRNDIARRTIRIPGVTRYMAVALLTGYVWLAAAGMLWVGTGLQPGRLSYDAAIHALFLGFVISMVVAHAPVIIPALTGAALPYNRAFPLPLVLLHASLALRIVGDLNGWIDGRMWGGMINAVAIAAFAAVVAATAAVAKVRAPAPLAAARG